MYILCDKSHENYHIGWLSLLIQVWILSAYLCTYEIEKIKVI